MIRASSYHGTGKYEIPASRNAWSAVSLSVLKGLIRQVTGRVYKLGPYRLPKEPAETAADPFAELERRAKEEGIALQEEQTPLPEEAAPEEELPPLTDAEIPF